MITIHSEAEQDLREGAEFYERRLSLAGEPVRR
jgi:hypothetical protein